MDRVENALEDPSAGIVLAHGELLPTQAGWRMGSLLITLPRDWARGRVHDGDRVILRGQLEAMVPHLNPGSFDRKKSITASPVMRASVCRAINMAHWVATFESESGSRATRMRLIMEMRDQDRGQIPAGKVGLLVSADNPIGHEEAL